MAPDFAFNWVIGFSWRTKKYKNALLYPEVRTQVGFNDCAHCSLCPSVEVRNQKIWVDTHEYNAKKSLRVDIDCLKRNHPPPQSVLTMVNNIKTKYQGLIKATGTNKRPWPFKVKDCLVYNTYPAAPNSIAAFDAVVKHIWDEGPVVGVFRVGTNYDRMTSDDVYVSSGQYIPLNPNKPNVPLVHAVCLTGIVEVKKGNYLGYAYEVLECGKIIPDIYRLRYILACEMDYVFVPIC